MTAITLATIESRPYRALPDTRWRVADLGTPTTTGADDAYAVIERTRATLTVLRLLVVSLLGVGAMVAGAFIGRL